MTIADDFGEIDWAYALTTRCIPGAAVGRAWNTSPYDIAATGQVGVVAVNTPDPGEIADRIMRLINSKPRSPTRLELITELLAGGMKLSKGT